MISNVSTETATTVSGWSNAYHTARKPSKPDFKPSAVLKISSSAPKTSFAPHTPSKKMYTFAQNLTTQKNDHHRTTQKPART
jgi:hypothetical protein